MNKKEILDKIMSISREKNIFAEEEIDYNAGLLEIYNINSFVAVQFLLAIEDGFGITIKDDDWLPKNYKSINTIADMISRYL